MFRIDAIIPASVVALGVMAGPSAAGQGTLSDALRHDEVGVFLERHHLPHLLALHLEARLESAPPGDRQAIAIRLATIYAELLERTDEPSSRISLEERSRALISIVPERQADELRLALLRGAFASVERVAENHRLRLAAPEEVERAQSTLTEILPQFATLRSTFEERLRTLERQRQRSNPDQSSQIVDSERHARDLFNRSLFLNAWALYYQAFLQDRPESARIAEQLFVRILDPDSPRFRIDQVSKDLLATEAYSRTLLGYALALSFTSPIDEPMRVLDLLEGDEVFPGIRGQVPAWRLAIVLQRRDFRMARTMLESAITDESGGAAEVPLLWVRLIAVYSLEAAERNTEAARLASEAIAELARRGEIDQVVDLAQRFGVETLGTDGFAPLYVRGVQAYKAAREAHDGEEPTTSPGVVQQYAAAVEWLQRALREPDADRFPDSGASAQMLMGWCLYFQSAFTDAQAAFEAAAENLPTSQAAESLWMAIVCLDRRIRAGGSSTLLAQLESKIETFIQRFPSSEYTPKLILRQSEVRSSRPSTDVVDELLRIPANSTDYDIAQRKAAQMLYELFRDSRGEDRLDFGRRYLAVAYPMWTRTDLERIAGDDTAFTIHVTRGRRILEVALVDGINRYETATDVLNRLDVIVSMPGVDLSEFESEFDYRRMQVALGTDSVTQARLYADRIWDRDRVSDWGRVSARAMLREAVREWRALPEEGDVRSALDRVLVYGKRVLQEFEGRDDALEDRAVLIFHATVAEAAMALWEDFGSNESGRFALVLYRTLLNAQPTNGLFLRSVGMLGETFGEYEQAREAWSKLASGRDPGTDAWYEAKYHLISTLLRIDPDRARNVFDQHRALHPELGNDAWRLRYEELDKNIDSAIRIRAIQQGDDDDDDDDDDGESTNNDENGSDEGATN